MDIYTFNWISLYYLSYADVELTENNYCIFKTFINEFIKAYNSNYEESIYTKKIDIQKLLLSFDIIVPQFILLIETESPLILVNLKNFIEATGGIYVDNNNIQIPNKLQNILFSFTDYKKKAYINLTELIKLILKSIFIGFPAHNNDGIKWFKILVKNIQLVGNPRNLNKDLKNLFQFLETREQLEFKNFIDKLDIFLPKKYNT